MRKRPPVRLLLALAAPTVVTGISAPPALAEDDQRDSIVVTGEVEAGEVDRAEVRQQSRAITPRGAVINQPLARFQAPLCPGVWGLSGTSAQFIIDRIYHNAEEAGLELDERAGCPANLIVAFVADPQSQFEAMVRADHFMIDPLPFDDRQAVRATQGPALAWHLVSTRTRDGQTRRGRPPVFDSTAISRLETGRRLDIEFAMVMIDADLLQDLDGLALADYATMRALARTRPVDLDAANAPTILSLFDDPVRSPQSLSAFDRAYLASLYAGPANQPGQLALRDVGERMEEDAAEQAP